MCECVSVSIFVSGDFSLAPFFFLAYSVWFVFIFLLLLLLILDASFHCNERMKELVWVWVGGNGKDMEGVGDGKP